MYIRNLSVLKKRLSGKCNEKIPVIVEIPLTWMESKRDGEQHREMVSQLLQAINKRDITPIFKPTYKHNTFSKRLPPKEGFTLSYHSIGKNKFVWHIKETPIKNYYSFDKLGFSGWSEISQNEEKYCTLINACDHEKSKLFVDNLRNNLKEANASKYEQSNTHFHMREKYVFFPLQLLDDLVVKLYRINALDALHEAIKIAESRKMHLVVKRHPFCKNRKIHQIEQSSQNLKYTTFTTASIHKILSRCRSVIVANSGVGLEALLYRLPVFSFAKSEYSLATKKINTKKDIQNAFTNQNNSNLQFSDNFIYYYLNEHCFNINDNTTILKMIDRAINDRKNSYSTK